MSRNAAFVRKIAYIGAIALLLLPIAAISQPATLNPGKTEHYAGGLLSQLRSRYNLAQAELGEIDPASETRTAPAAVRSLSKTTTAAISTITFGENDRRFPGTTTP